ncbi:uncharacterized protein PAM68-like [Humulus lupulus]|uniref:uncharacterized protein PAM68-like n=1 Tax=Humulus lupulus TaxID=3486 RepID=UPI002B405F0D|nr:uncharacterized protein PAM68-like [Humulus lupulus]
MKSLLSISPPPSSLYLPNSSSSPWKPKSPTRLFRTIMASKSPNQTRGAQRKSLANAKGFTGTPVPSAKETPVPQNSGKRTSNAGPEEEVPQVVFNRMMVRILVSVGVPMATGLALLKIFEIGKEQGLLVVPVWVALLTTFLTFGVSSFGIAYGALSTSWDAESDGSLLGFEEAQKNWVDMWREEDESTG